MRYAPTLWILLLTASAATAQTTERLALADVVRNALAKSPEIAAAEKRYEAARLRPVQERSLPDPMVSAGYSSAGRPWPGAGLGVEPTANVGFMISQEIPYPGKRDLKASIASREADAERELIAVARLEVSARAAIAYYGLAYSYAAADVLTRSRTLLETLLRVSEHRYAVGHASQPDVLKAQTQLTIVELQAERLRRERASREGELNALLNRPAGSPIGRPDDLALRPFDVTFDSLFALAVEHSPMLRREQILIDRSAEAIAAARKDYRPDFTLSGGYYYMGSMPPMYEVRFDVTVPLQRARRAAAVSERTSMLAESRSGYESSRLRLQSRLQEDYEMANTSQRLAQLYRDTVLPQARLTLESSMAGYETGRSDFLSVLMTVGGVLEYEMGYLEALRDFQIALARLDETTGAPHTTPGQ